VQSLQARDFYLKSWIEPGQSHRRDFLYLLGLQVKGLQKLLCVFVFAIYETSFKTTIMWTLQVSENHTSNII